MIGARFSVDNVIPDKIVTLEPQTKKPTNRRLFMRYNLEVITSLVRRLLQQERRQEPVQQRLWQLQRSYQQRLLQLQRFCQQRRGRWLRKSSSGNPDQGCQPMALSKPVTVLVVLERWRGFCAADQMCRLCGQINAALPSRFLVVGFSVVGIQGWYDAGWT